MNYLTEKFWMRLYQKYPVQVQQFCSWLREYKIAVRWPEIFGKVKRKGRTFEEHVRFRDLPDAMQWGIFCQFTAENHPTDFGEIPCAFQHQSDMNKIPKFIENYFSEIKSHHEPVKV